MVSESRNSAYDHAALIIVDVQRGFINSNTDHIPGVVQGIQSDYQHVFCTKFMNSLGSPWTEWLHWHRFLPGSTDTELAFEPTPNAIILEKGRYTCVDSQFISQLASRNIAEIHLCGIDTDICVSKCAVDLFENGIRPIVLAKYCASHAGPSAHERGLATLRRYIGPEQIALA